MWVKKALHPYSQIQRELRWRISRYADVTLNLRCRKFKRILETRYAYIRLRYERRKSPTPSYLRVQFSRWPLGGASVEFGVEYVNAYIRRFTNVRAPVAVKIRRLRKAFSGVKLFQQIAGLVNVKYGRRSRVEI